MSFIKIYKKTTSVSFNHVTFQRVGPAADCALWGSRNFVSNKLFLCYIRLV